MSHYIVQYREGTSLGDRFSTIKYPWKGPGFATAEQAAKVMAACPNVEFMEVVESGVSSTRDGNSQAQAWENKGGPNRVVSATLPGPDHLLEPTERG